MCIYLLFSQTIGYFMVKNLLLLWILQLFQFAFLADLFQWITVSSRTQSYQTHLYLFNTVYFCIYTICVVMEIYHLSGLVPRYRFTFSSNQIECTMIYYLLILPATSRAIVRHQNSTQIQLLPRRWKLAIRTINVVQHPAVTEYFLFTPSYILQFLPWQDITKTVQ